MNEDKLVKEESVDDALFRGHLPTPTDREALLAQYRLFVETSEALVMRRQGANTFFLSVNSVILAAGGLLVRDGKFSDMESLALIGLSVGGCVLSFVWWRLITSFRQLSRGKFDVIHAIERHLPARMFTAEWAVLGRGDNPTKYMPFTRTETTTPWVFGVFHFLLVGMGTYVLLCEVIP